MLYSILQVPIVHQYFISNSVLWGGGWEGAKSDLAHCGQITYWPQACPVILPPPPPPSCASGLKFNINHVLKSDLACVCARRRAVSNPPPPHPLNSLFGQAMGKLGQPAQATSSLTTFLLPPPLSSSSHFYTITNGHPTTSTATRKAKVAQWGGGGGVGTTRVAKGTQNRWK
jgi:hypothetical protein